MKMEGVFSPMSPESQRANRAAYRQFLFERDGALDIERRILPHRERDMVRFERSPARIREIDRALFQRQYERFDARQPMTREALLLMALVKLNAAEAYGVDHTIDYARERARRDADDMELFLHVEESYHTRILLSTARLYGMRIDTPFQPSLSLRTLILGIARAPEVLSRPLILAGEIVGTLIFLNALQAARDILRHDGELRDAIEERLTEVLIDEVGHISFNRMILGPAGLARSRALLPLVAAGIAQTMPILGALGLRPSVRGADSVAGSNRLPKAVRDAAFVV